MCYIFGQCGDWRHCGGCAALHTLQGSVLAVTVNFCCGKAIVINYTEENVLMIRSKVCDTVAVFLPPYLLYASIFRFKPEAGVA